MRKGRLILTLAAATIAVAVAVAPWWLGAALRPVARLAHARFESYERVGYSRFRLTKVVWERADPSPVRAELDRVEADTPVVWLWRCLWGGEPRIAIGSWRVVAGPSGKPAEPGAGLVRLHGKLIGKVVPRLRRWLPRATADDGRVSWPGGAIALAGAEWRDGMLRLRGLQWKAVDGVDAVAKVEGGSTIQAHLTKADPAAEADVAWTGAEITGHGSLWAQPWRGAFHFAPTGWRPTEGDIEAKNWDVAADTLKLPAVYAGLRGGAHFAWKDHAFTIALDVTAAPRAGQEAPPIEAHAQLSGDHAGWEIRQLRLTAPFAQADLSGPVAIGYDGRTRTERAQLAVRADLAKQPWAEARGRVSGTVELQPAENRAVTARFSLAADGVAVRSLVLQHAEAAGRIDWPRIELERASLVADGGTRVALHGAFDARTRRLDGVAAEGEIARAWLGERLPAALGWQKAGFSATVSGPLSRPAHAGAFTLAGLQFSPVKAVDARGTWRGDGLAASAVEVTVDRGHTKVTASGSLDRQAARIATLRVTENGRERWHNDGAATIAWAPAKQIDNLRLVGPDSRIEANASAGGAVAVSAAGLRDDWVREWIAFAGPAWRLTTFKLDADLGAAKPRFSTEATGEIELEPRVADVSLKASGDAGGVKLDELRVVDGQRTLTAASGRLPLIWDPKASSRWRPDFDAPLELHLTTDPESPLWSALAAQAGIDLTGAAAAATFTGTLRNPAGQMRLEVRAIDATEEPLKSRLPKIEQLGLTLHVDQEAISLESAQATVEGQHLEASARLPMDPVRWEQLWRGGKNLDWRDIDGRIDIPDAAMEPLSRRLPDLIATQGRVSAHVTLANGGHVTGALKISDAATRPIAPLGVAQNVNAELSLDGRTVDVKSFSARIGGQPVTLTGTATLPVRGRPRVAMALKAENVPLVRKAGLLVRTDLDLHADTGAGGVTRLTGKVNLRDCLVLSDITALLPGGEKGVSRQAPYFAVKAAPFNTWQLGVELRGDHAIRMRTAVFKGTASAHFQLGGTLGEPRAVGEVSVDDGQVLFPFATFDVQLGAVRLQEADPFHPELNVTATSRRFGYEVRLTATGSPEAPNVSFSSNPALDSAQILLMVMTGQKPATDTFTSNGSQRLTRVGAFVGQEVIQGLGFGGGDENRLEITSGEQITMQGRETYQIEYKLNDDWSLVGEYDEFDDYNAGVKWRVYTQGGGHDRK